MDPPKKPKYYKMHLDPSYCAEMVCEKTHKAWEKSYQENLKKSNNEEKAMQTSATDDLQAQCSSFMESPEEWNEQEIEESQETEKNFENYEYDYECDDYDKNDENLIEETIGSTEDFPSIFNSRIIEGASFETDSSSTFPDGDKVMFVESKITVNNVVEMVVAYGVKYGLTQKARESLIEMLKIFAGPNFKDFKISNYKLAQVFNAPSDKISYHFYCHHCPKKDKLLHSSYKQDIKGQKKKCETCNKENIISLGYPNFFVHVNLKYQLEMLLQNKEVADAVHLSIKNNTKNTLQNDIHDIQDSELYKETTQSKPNTLTYTISTDGAPLFHISKRGFWPLQILLNFLPINIRFKYILLCGIMVLLSEPKPDLMNLFISTFNDQAFLLFSEGMRVKLPGDVDLITLIFSPLSVVADSIARPILQFRFQFNAYCSCSYCYHPGRYIKKASGIRFPFLEEEPKLRSNKSHSNDVQYVKDYGTHYRGVKGESAFCHTPNLDMVRGFPLDYLHNSLLGVTEQLWNIWNKNVFSPEDRKNIDEEILRIKPPRDLHRLPEKISKKSLWKATHWKSWLLFFSLPILSKYLPNELLEHYALFINSIHTLLKTKITKKELDQCEENLLVFVANYHYLYHEEKMTFNVHIVLHIVQSVKKSGPLWATSAFPFENNIYNLKQMINGPKSVEQQIANKSLVQLRYQLTPRNPYLLDKVSEYCQNLFTTKTCTLSSTKIGDITLFGPSLRNKFQVEQEYERCVIENCVYSSLEYLRSKKFDDTVFVAKNNKIFQITKIVVTSEKNINFEVRELILEPFLIGNTLVSHIFHVKHNVQHAPISVSEVKGKVVVLELEKSNYVCLIPNTIEAQ
ncbi:uncharacterized protein LOC127279133 [Leptopilina boulardi]|uniref:uncharacterized protein LOC127279133 n=1 Tax=Leptopilina boulardi TaxID=63433 RepID=UPI0021F64AD5|nr:uncharacterized protein LOC127279133 [Leptopilina boulardi]XP_051157258.1 uncharacterized protein LOC127279133 [Leptopilina boulardi]